MVLALLATGFTWLCTAIEQSEHLGQSAWLTVSIGFGLGAFSLFLLHKILPHLHIGLENERLEGGKTSFHRSLLLLPEL